MAMRVLTFCTVLLTLSPVACGDDWFSRRIKVGRVEFGIPVIDSFVTVPGDRATVKVFSGGDITNVHTDGGTRVDVGIRSLIRRRGYLRDSVEDPAAEPFPQSHPDTRPSLLPEPDPHLPAVNPQPALPALPQTPQPTPEPENQIPSSPPRLEIPQFSPAPADGAGLDRRLAGARQAVAHGAWQAAELLATDLLSSDPGNVEALSIRAESRISQAEQTSDLSLLQQGLADVNKAMQLRAARQEQALQERLIWMVGMNQLATLETDRKRAIAAAREVDDFAQREGRRFPAELRGGVYQEQAFARRLLGRRRDALESLRNAAIRP